MPQRVFDRKTFLPDKGVLVSTVAYDFPIGADGRNAETMVFPARSAANTVEGWEVVSWLEMAMRSHGFVTDPRVLAEEHERMVRDVREGRVELSSQEEEE